MRSSRPTGRWRRRKSSWTGTGPRPSGSRSRPIGSRWRLISSAVRRPHACSRMSGAQSESSIAANTMANLPKEAHTGAAGNPHAEPAVRHFKGEDSHEVRAHYCWDARDSPADPRHNDEPCFGEEVVRQSQLRLLPGHQPTYDRPEAVQAAGRSSKASQPGHTRG